MELTHLKRNFLQELLGSVTDRFAMVQQVSAAGIAIDATVTGSGRVVSSLSATLNHAANVLVLVAVSYYAGIAGTITCTVGGASATTESNVSQGTVRSLLFSAFRSSAANEIVLVSFSSYAARAAFVATSFTGTVTSAPFLEGLTTAGASTRTSASVSIVAGTSGRRIFNFIAAEEDSDASNSISITPGGSQTQIGVANLPDAADLALGGETNYQDSASAQTLTGTITYPSGQNYAWVSLVAGILPSGPPPPPASDFTITATPSSQSIGAGATASSTLNLAAGGGFSGTVTLAVTSGCPSGVTCTVSPTSISTYPNSATLTVPTLITTSGTFPVLVTGTSGSLTHTATFTVTVGTASSYNFNVRTGATQVVVTVSWTGTGTASVTIAGPGGTPTLSESGAVVYDRISYVSGSSTPTNIHRVTFTLSSPPTGTWTAYVSQSGATVTIEVS